MFKPGDVVVCVDPEGNLYLELNKTYTVKRTATLGGTEFVKLGELNLYCLSHRFIPVEDWAEVKEDDLLSLM